jgi:hypothetical protein
LKPDPKVPAFVVVGHGARIIVSKDDGKTWQEVHSYTPPDIQGGAQGLRDGAFGLIKP